MSKYWKVSLVIEAETASEALSHVLWNELGELPEYTIHEASAIEMERYE